MDTTISISNKEFNIKFNSKDENFISNIIYKKLMWDSNLYDKIKFLNNILESPVSTKLLLSSDIMNCKRSNIIEILIFDKCFNSLICSDITDLLIKIFNIFILDSNNTTNHSTVYSHLTPIYFMKCISDTFLIKSKYEYVSKTVKDSYTKRDRELLNFTEFLINFYNKLDTQPLLKIIKNDILNILIDKLDIGIINYLDEIELRKKYIDELEVSLHDYEFLESKRFINKKQIKNKLNNNIKRLQTLNTFKFYIFNTSTNNFIDSLIDEYNKIEKSYFFMNIKEIKLIEIVIKYKQHQTFIYKNEDKLLVFISNIINNYTKHIDKYSNKGLPTREALCHVNVMHDALDLFYRIIYNKHTSHDKIFVLNNKNLLENLLLVSINLIEINKDISEYKKEKLIINYSRLLNSTYKNFKGTFLYIIETQRKNINTFSFILFEIVKDVFDEIVEFDEYDYIEYSSGFSYTESLFKLVENIFICNRDILFSLELKNKFLETIFFIFDKVYVNDNLTENYSKTIKNIFTETFDKFMNKITLLVKQIYEKDYDLLVGIYGIDFLEFKKDTWEQYNKCNKLELNIDKLESNIADLKTLIDIGFKDCLDPICSTFIEHPIVLDDMIIDGFIIYKYIFEKNENPFNRKYIDIKSIEEDNFELNNINKIQKYKEDNKYFLYSNFIKNLKKN
jgi:hypothetical protein